MKDHWLLEEITGHYASEVPLPADLRKLIPHGWRLVKSNAGKGYTFSRLCSVPAQLTILRHVNAIGRALHDNKGKGHIIRSLEKPGPDGEPSPMDIFRIILSDRLGSSCIIRDNMTPMGQEAFSYVSTKPVYKVTRDDLLSLGVQGFSVSCTDLNKDRLTALVTDHRAAEFFSPAFHSGSLNADQAPNFVIHYCLLQALHRMSLLHQQGFDWLDAEGFKDTDVGAMFGATISRLESLGDGETPHALLARSTNPACELGIRAVAYLSYYLTPFLVDLSHMYGPWLASYVARLATLTGGEREFEHLTFTRLPGMEKPDLSEIRESITEMAAEAGFDESKVDHVFDNMDNVERIAEMFKKEMEMENTHFNDLHTGQKAIRVFMRELLDHDHVRSALAFLFGSEALTDAFLLAVCEGEGDPGWKYLMPEAVYEGKVSGAAMRAEMNEGLGF